MDTCTDDFLRLTAPVGGIDCTNSGPVSIHNPAGLDNGTMPAIELLLVVGAIAGLVHARRQRGRSGDASGLVVWWSGIVCLLLIEPVAYFPQWFGVQEHMGLTFVHNQFSVQFLFNRLPLYIVAMYPAFAYVSYALVDRAGVLRRHGPVVGATCVAFVFHCSYEVIDHVGPQLGWWLWNNDAPTGAPRLGVVPYVNLAAFSLAIPFGIALLTLVTARGSSGVLRRVVLVSVGTLPILFVSSIPTTVLDLAGMTTSTARIVGTWLLVIAAGAVTAWALVGAARHGTPTTDPAASGRFVVVAAAAYLLVSAGVWLHAAGDYREASERLSPGDFATVGAWYSALCAGLCVVLVVLGERAAAARADGGEAGSSVPSTGAVPA
ncbi:MAG TPA: hypothetical protein VFI47_22140 [Acidimicrobiales bacterium]|nr:hypothetical protein [Acidimicrobiales bacterium]